MGFNEIIEIARLQIANCIPVAAEKTIVRRYHPGITAGLSETSALPFWHIVS
jgi:hypothetical protein